METVEVVVYMAIAFAIGALILAFLGRWDVQSAFDRFKGAFTGEKQQYEEIEVHELPRAAFETWQSCGLGTTDLNRTVYVTGDAPLNKSMIFSQIRQANLCRTLQWNASGCGTRDDVIFNDMAAPAVLTLRCDAASRKLIIA